MTRTALAAWVVGGVATATLFASLGWGLLHGAQQQPSSLVGSQVPDLTIQSLDGDLVSLRAMQGTPLVINFWASWCVPCRQEAPVLAAAAQRMAGKAQFVGVDIVHGSYRDFGVTAPPETFFVDRFGIVQSRIIGPVDSHRMEIYLIEIFG